MSDTKWGLYITDHGEPIYDITLDKERQIGAATLVISRFLHEYRRGLIDEVQKRSIETIITEMRNFVVGNTTSSFTKFDSAHSYYFSEMCFDAPTKVSGLITMCARIVEYTKQGVDYIDELIVLLEAYKLYDRNNAMEYLES